MFTKALILNHFNLECHIWVVTYASGNAIDGVLSKLTSDFGQRSSVAHFFQKMIPAQTQYKTHDRELLAIVEAFKTWWHYLEGCKHEVIVLIDNNNILKLIDTKNLSFCQVYWAQKLFRYHF